MVTAISPELDSAVETYCKLYMEKYNAYFPASTTRYPGRLTYVVLKKYIKVTRENKSTYCFILIADDDKWKAGDILRPASHNSPNREKRFGNVLAGRYTINLFGL